jgi:hypothetical protein
MMATLLLVAAALILPTILVLGALFLLGSAVIALADGSVADGGLRRPAI